MQDVVTRLRLACARATLWLGWEFACLGMKVFVRRDHPTRVYLQGGRSTARKTQMNALRFESGPRLRPGLAYKAAAIGLVQGALLLPHLYEMI